MKIQQSTFSKGFALIATISVLSLLVMIAIGMLSLSAVTTRSVDHEVPRQEAKANARMALMMALGELQKMAGPDTRITAPADIVKGNSSAPKQLTGVWRSWEGADHDSEGKPRQPEYDEKFKESTSGGRFLGWLISDKSQSLSDPDNTPTLIKNAETVPILSTGTLSTDIDSDLEVHMRPTSIDGEEGEKGGYAWWIQGLNSKALIKPMSEAPDANEFAEWANKQNSNLEYQVEAFEINDDPTLAKAISFGSYELVEGTPDIEEIVKENYHAITHFSTGLLTNAATGGWKRDLSLFAEKWQTSGYNYQDLNPDYRSAWGERVPQNGYSTYNITPGVEHLGGLKYASSGQKALIYGWGSNDKTSMTWNSLADFASLYKNLQTNAGGAPTYKFYNSLNSQSNAMNGERFSIIEPLLVRWQMYFSLASEKIDASDDSNYRPLIGVHPYFTYYNPYNVAIDNTGFNREYLQLNSTSSNQTNFPFYLRFGLGDDQNLVPQRMSLLLGTKNNSRRNVFNVIPQPSSFAHQLFQPGESKVIGKSAYIGLLESNADKVQSIEVNTGVTDQPYFVRIRDAIGAVKAEGYPAGTAYSASWFSTGNNNSVPIWLRTGAGRVGSTRSMPFHVSDDSELFEEKSSPNTDGEATAVNIEDVEWSANKFEPFVSMSMTMRNLFETHAPTKGYLNNKILRPMHHGGGSGGIEQQLYEWNIDRLNGQVDPKLISFARDLSAGDDVSGFVGTSYTSLDGLARWVTAELPTQPLLSLIELQHFDPAFINPNAPRMANVLGNSHASAFIEKGGIQVTGTEGYDHSYVFNHLMFDDWFVSSISPELEPFTSIEEKSLDQVLEEFFTGAGELKNSAYRPTKIISKNEVTSYIEENFKNSGTSWNKIASELEVEGMFNVNSTSVEAWKALLTNMKETKVPHQTIDTVNGGASLNEGPAYQYPMSRTSLAGDASSAGSDSQLVAQPYDWTEVQLEALAEQIVEQVKLRGPFLSLSEFINRQLSDDEDLAMAGAVESALIALSELGASNPKNPYGELLSAFPPDEEESYTNADGETVTYAKYSARKFSDHDTYYSFPKAAEGHVAYGTPGWPRQADVLRPIAPLLSVRDDSFVIRAYGEAFDSTGNKVQAWCEATVVRTAEYVNPNNISTDYTNLSMTNQLHGRKFKVVSFRWLNKDEV
ncbi:hypothetical protein ACFPK9_12400 [Rubritalea spongiae]|uniref:Verru_Chthon cassette protein A n=1 Tax=Rubritalea spongiae TaxID=430797 RepID=A0ABW5E0E2_9BACT